MGFLRKMAVQDGINWDQDPQSMYIVQCREVTVYFRLIPLIVYTFIFFAGRLLQYKNHKCIHNVHTEFLKGWQN